MDSRTWVYDFARDLPAGVRCTFRLRLGLTSLAGKGVVGQQPFAFSTGGPAIRSSRPSEGDFSRIDEEQAFVLELDAEPTEASLLKHVSFEIEGVPERVGIRLLAGEAHKKILRSLRREPSPFPTVVLQARPLFRAGETVHMKHLLRMQTMQGFSLIADAQRPTLVSIRHLGSNERYELPLKWDAAGIAESTWQIPKEAKLGRYEVVLVQPAQERRSGEFRVEEFRVPLMKGILRLPADPQVAVSQLPVDLSVQYLAGGGARSLPVVLRAQIRPKPASTFEAFEGFVFANGRVEEGIVRQEMGVEEEAMDEMEEAEGEEEAKVPAQRFANGAGAAHQEVWVAGSGDWWFEVQDSDRIDLLPERRRYEPGETARLQVRMPFRRATAPW